MRLFDLVGCLALLNVAQAVLIFTDPTWTNVVTGVPFTVTWSGSTGAITITLDNGTATDPNVVHTIQTGLISNSYVWTPGSFAIPGHTFFLGLTDSTGAQSFSPSFVVGASQSTTSTTSTTTTATSSPTTSQTTSTTSTTAAATSSPTTSQTTSTTSTTAAATSSTTASQTTGTGPQYSQTSSPAQTTAASSSNGLSRGAKVGIGVGVALGVFVLAASGALALVWRKRHNRTLAEQNTTFEMEGRPRFDILEKSRGGSNKGVSTRELDGEGVRHELQ